MPSTVHIRAAADTDAAAICAIHNAQGVATTASYALRPGTVAERVAWLAAQRRADLPVLVATGPDDEVVGFASYGRFRELPGYDLTVEHSVYAAPGHEYEGIGTALMTALVEQARQAGVHAMVGAVDAGNESSLAFHERLGCPDNVPTAGNGRGRGCPVAPTPPPDRHGRLCALPHGCPPSPSGRMADASKLDALAFPAQNG